MSGFLWSILAIVILQASVWNEATPSPSSSLMTVLLTWGGTLLLAWYMRRRERGSGQARPRWRSSSRIALPLLAFGCACHVAEYPLAIRSLPILGWPWLSTFLALLPYMLLRWTALCSGHPAQRHTDRDEPELSTRWVARLQWQIERLPFLPFVFFDGLAEVAEGWYWTRILFDHLSIVQVVVGLLGMVLILEGLPRLVPHLWSLQALPPGELREELVEVARRSSFRYREIYLWNTGRTMANAAIMGLSNRGRAVILTDLLVERLDTRELVAVFAHEMGHAKRRHLFYFLGIGVIFLVALVACLTLVEEWDGWARVGGVCDPARVSTVLIDGTSIACLLGFGLAFFWAFGRFSRACETEADLHALKVLGEPRALGRALLRVVGTHPAVRERRGWRHESPGDRIRFLEGCVRDPGLLARFEARLRAWKTIVAILGVAIVGVVTFWYATIFRTELAVTGLALGAYELSLAQAEHLDPLDQEELRALVALGRSHARGPTDEGTGASPSHDEVTRRLTEAMRDRLRRGELEPAYDLLVLLSLRSGVGAGWDRDLALSVSTAVELLEGGFRRPGERWAERRAAEGWSIPDDIERGILDALDARSGRGTR